ncbi:LysE/ArgO family amino acid transporter [Humidesulfovibrio mexicanus]|jgi:L-lysine exporter family protein LysE/ArgO|nr:LysE/ArgO family amino acid transporter [Humidesulfovibrio mexicanus]
MAIGAQNVFVLTQGARGHRPWFVAGVCTACDAVLIAAGVGGVGALTGHTPWLGSAFALCGAVFLLCYGYCAFRRVLCGGRLVPMEQDAPPERRVILMTALAVSLLNPHALLDTVVLIGGLSSRLAPEGRALFGLGAVTASACWFYSLSLGGKLLAPVLRRPGAWRVLDALVGVTMWGLAAGIGGDALVRLAS